MESIRIPRQIALRDLPDLIGFDLFKFLYIAFIKRTFLTAVASEELADRRMLYRTLSAYFFNLHLVTSVLFESTGAFTAPALDPL